MKSKRNLRPQITPKIKQRFSLWYVAGGVAIALLIGVGIFFYLNISTTHNAVANTTNSVSGDPTGPGGVGSTTTESGFWYRADSISSNPENNDPVDTWDDQFTNPSLNAFQTGSARPSYQKNIINQYPALYFDGADDQFFVADADAINTSKVPYLQKSFTIVFQTGSDVTTTQVLYEQGGNGRGISFYVDNGTLYAGAWNIDERDEGDPWPTTCNATNCSGGFVNSGVGTVNANSTYIAMFTYYHDGSDNQTGVIKGYLNNVSAFATVDTGIGKLYGHGGDVGIGNINGSTNLHNQQNARDEYYYQGYIAEFVFYNRVLNEAERLLIFNYLSGKYDIPLATNDVYTMDNSTNGNYDHAIAGIGRADINNVQVDAQGSGIVRVKNATDLQDEEYLIWGHNNQSLSFLEPTDVPSSVENRMERVWGVSEQGEVGAVDMVFDLSALEPLKADDLRLLVDTNNDGKFDDENEAGGGVIGNSIPLGDGLYLFSEVDALQNTSSFTLGSTDPNITTLPVELLYFRAKVTDMETVRLEWKTASEINNDYFTVERSQDGTEWQAVTKIKGAGNATEEQWYTGFDQRPYSGTSYFRLKQTDFDGKFTYSEVVAATVEASKMLPLDVQPLTVRTVAPNPFDQSFYVDFELNQAGTVQVQLIGLTGRVVSTSTVEGRQGENRYEFYDQQGLEPGTYLLRIVFGNESGTMRVVKQ